MNAIPERYLPNDISCQIDYKPNPLIMDRRGQWTAILCEKLEYPDWRIIENRLDVINKAQNARGYVSFNKCVFTLTDVNSHEVFATKASEFLETVFALDGFDNHLQVKRLGVRARFCTPFPASFDKLLARFTTLYIDLKDAAKSALGENTIATDAAAPWYFKDEHGDFKTYCGPMKKDQIAEFFNYRAATDLPDVGLYYDIDYYDLSQEDKEEIEVESILLKLPVFVRAAWDRHQTVRNLINR